MTRELRDKRTKLLKISKGLAETLKDVEDYNKVIVLRDLQDKAYRKWLFYDKLIKAMENDNERKN